MKLGSPSYLFVALLALAPLNAPAQTASAPAASSSLDFGDFSSGTLLGKAWGAFGAQNYDAAIAYTDKCITMYGEQALAMQKALTALPTDKTTAFAQWALNDVGTCYFLKGQALQAQGKKDAAIAAYKFLLEKLPYAQSWDNGGFFWKPADAAKEKLTPLEYKALQ